MNETIALLARRRSLAPANMTGPGPSAAEIETLLTIASRVPDHGKLAPWRFILFEGAARDRAGRIALALKLADDPALDEAGRAAERQRFSHAPLVVAVVSRAAPHVKIPEWEQTLSAGAACMNLTIAASAPRSALPSMSASPASSTSADRRSLWRIVRGRRSPTS
jgi:nitroreductase